MGLSDIFLSKCKSNEMIVLLNGSKPVLRQGFYSHELKKVEEFCRKENLFLVKSMFRVSAVEKGYSNKGVLSEDGMTFVYISRDELLANKAAYFEIMQDHFNLGLVFGYPKCCSLFFLKEFPIRSKLDNNYETPVRQGSRGKRFPFYNNIFRRDEDFCLISHFPCSLNCRESQKIGKAFFEAIKKENEKEARILEQKLKESIHDLEFF